MEHFLYRIHLLFFLLVFQFPLCGQSLSVDTISENIQKTLPLAIKTKNRTIVQSLYQSNRYHPLWVGKKNKMKMSQLIQALNDPLFNYKHKPFDQSSIKRLFFILDNTQVSTTQQASIYARLDLILSHSLIRLIRFIVEGDVDWKLVQKKFQALKKSDDVNSVWEMQPKIFRDTKGVINALKKETIYPYLKSLLPMQQRYKSLIELLKQYTLMDTFPKISYTQEALKLGDRSSTVKEIKKRLQISGDYPKYAKIDTHFDETLQSAVINYQKRYLLKIDGKVDKKVTYYLNQPVKDNIEAIITNLDKTKLYPKDFGNEYIEVNIPDFNLRYFQNSQKRLKMGIVIGRLDRPTPLFSDKVEYMVLNPTWTIPDNLIKRDLIHVFRDNPNYLLENDIHVFLGKKEIEITPQMLEAYENSDKKVPYRFVQFSGENNALGRIKFMFPNKYAVYLHDTDNKELLTRRYKLYSSGCMRLDNPFALMDILLEHVTKRYSRSTIEAIIESNHPKTIKLNRAIAVHILYFTVYKEGGLAYFKNDVYLYDKIIQESVEGNSKEEFTIPKNRMISVKKNGQPLTNKID